MAIYEVEHTNWVAVREYTLVDADSKEEAQRIFEDRYDAHAMEWPHAVPEFINVQVDNVERYPLKNAKNLDAFEILD